MSQAVASAAVAATPPSMGEWNAPETSRAASAPSQFISFAIGDDQYGVDIMAVREIKGWSEITHLPKQPDYVRGVLKDDDSEGFVIDAQGSKITLPRGASDASLFAHHVDRSKLYAVRRIRTISRSRCSHGLIGSCGRRVLRVTV